MRTTFFIFVIPNFVIHVKRILLKKYRLPSLWSAHSPKLLRNEKHSVDDSDSNVDEKRVRHQKLKTDSKPGENNNHFGLLLSLTFIVFQTNTKRKIFIKNQNTSK